MNFNLKTAKDAVNAFLQQEPDNDGLVESAPEAHAYEFQSSKFGHASKLLDNFVEEKTTFEKEEMNSKHAYDLLMQDLGAQVDQTQRRPRPTLWHSIFRQMLKATLRTPPPRWNQTRSTLQVSGMI